MTGLPLEGIRVVELCVVYSGPFATWLLASLGAEVIHVDSIQHQPDMCRMFTMWLTEDMMAGKDGSNYPRRDQGERPWNRRAQFARFAWNKCSCCINLKDPKGKEVFKKLIKTSDIFMENNSPGMMDRLGLGPQVLSELNPGLTSISMPSYGNNGPYKDYVGWGANAESLVGHYWIMGYDDDQHPLSNTPTYHMDSAAGALAAFGAIMGLHQRRRTGKGMVFDFAQIESSIPQMGEVFMDYAWNKRDCRAMGNRHPTDVQGCYRCRGEDSWVNITISNDKHWEGLCKVLGNPPWTLEERFSDQAGRRKNHDDFDARIEEWTIKEDNFEVFHLLQRNGVPAGPVYTEKDTYNDPQLNARDFFEIISQEDIGTYRYPGFMWKMSATPLRVRSAPPLMGEHNDYVFREILGMSEAEITELEKEKIIGGDRYLWA